MRHLYQKIYLTIVVALLAVVVTAGAFWRFGAEPEVFQEGFQVAGEVFSISLAPAGASQPEQQQALESLAKRIKLDLTLFDTQLQPLAQTGRPLPPPWRDRPGRVGGLGEKALALRLPDGRWIVAGAPPRGHHPAIGLVFVLGGIALLIALCAFPVVRGLTRRLERLQQGVENLGSGNLSSRVKVEGRDEVARLAQSFNNSAARIEELVNSHRLLLAHASHELRTPLSRIRLGLELLSGSNDPKYRSAIEQDIAELDKIVDDILLASRLDLAPDLQTREEVDLLALAAEEAVHYEDCSVQGEPVTVRGDARLLRHVIRNLLDNAARHGKPPCNVTVRREGSTAIVDVADGGPGIPEAERDRVFVPFYRLNGETNGSGLGLSLAKRIAQMHGGNAFVYRFADRGSCIGIDLPIADQPSHDDD
jgi:signal transduction histidine kinase